MLTQCIARISLVVAQYLETILFHFAANAEVIVDRIARVVLGILHLYKQLVIIGGADLVQLLQSHEELPCQGAEANLVVRP